MNSGRCSLIIYGENLDFETICQHLSINPSRIVRREDSIPGRNDKSQYDFWIYEVKFEDTRQPNDVLQELLDNISSAREFIAGITTTAKAYIKCFVQSDLAQLRFYFEPETLADLSALGLRLEVAVLSWGGVEDD